MSMARVPPEYDRPGGEAEYARMAYGPWVEMLCDGDRAKIEALDEADAAYFWVMLRYEVEKRTADIVLHGMEDRVARSLAGNVAQDESPTPFSDAESAISAHGWFGRPLVGGK